ncbi:hypothetical protein RSOLAG1IB_00840 [Rhizoctonia solani AG-1 IB]|uniref:Uncharacterized protein n=1 Tax=Thanatephorus cucumeris (strain AG1-IB / isolate 7/3/14) TaxID=1108050 RepID=A0A0B7F434_THACB|nr:hypothetical protein RSOLAG1IB_00840 [Rhizoctonia solani AG-1 IB]
MHTAFSEFVWATSLRDRRSLRCSWQQHWNSPALCPDCRGLLTSTIECTSFARLFGVLPGQSRCEIQRPYAHAALL